MGAEEITNNNNDKQGPCLAPMGGGLNAREAMPRPAGLGGRENAGQVTQLGNWCEPTDWHACACPTLRFIPLGYK